MSTDTHLSDLLLALDYSDLEKEIPNDLLPFIGFLISKASQSIVETVDESMTEFDITSRHYGIMLLLSRNSGLPQATIGEKLKIDRTTMVKYIDKLEQHNFVERIKDPNDRRAYALSLTEKGYAVLPEISQRVIESEALALATLEKEEIQQLFHILLKLLGSK